MARRRVNRSIKERKLLRKLAKSNCERFDRKNDIRKHEVTGEVHYGFGGRTCFSLNPESYRWCASCEAKCAVGYRAKTRKYVYQWKSLYHRPPFR